MTIKEALNQIDHRCIDEDLHFYDFRSLYEAVQQKPLSAEQKTKLSQATQKAQSGRKEDLDNLGNLLKVIELENSNDPTVKAAVDKIDEDYFYEDAYTSDELWDKYGTTDLDIINAGNEEDVTLKEKLVDAPQEVIDKLIEILAKYGFILDDSIEHENPSKSLLFGDTHIQVINPDSFIDDTDEISVQEQLREYISREMIDEIHSLDQESNCPITWNFGPNNEGQVTGGLDIMKQYVEESLDEDLDISSYQQLSSTIHDNGNTYALFRKREDNKTKWAAAEYIDGSPDLENAFEITYDQARGFEPLSKVGKISKDLGKKLLPKNESIKTKRINYCPNCTNNTLEEVEDGYYVCDECGAEYTGYPAFEGGLELTPVDDECLTESSEPTDEDWEDFYKLEEEIANVMHSIDSDLDDAQGNIYHDDYDGTRRLTFRFVCGVDEISEKIRKQIINALENYLNKTKFNQFIYIRLYPVEVPVGASYEVIIDAETEPAENLTEASYGGAYDIEDDMYFTKEEIVEFVDDIINELSAEFGKNYFIEEVGFADPTNLYISIEDTGGYSHHHTFHIDMRRIRLPKDIYKYKPFVLDVFKSKFGNDYEYEQLVSESMNEDTVKQNGKWVNKGKEGTHGKFATKKAADAQRRAIWVNWNK